MCILSSLDVKISNSSSSSYISSLPHDKNLFLFYGYRNLCCYYYYCYCCYYWLLFGLDCYFFYFYIFKLFSYLISSLKNLDLFYLLFKFYLTCYLFNKGVFLNYAMSSTYVNVVLNTMLEPKYIYFNSIFL